MNQNDNEPYNLERAIIQARLIRGEENQIQAEAGLAHILIILGTLIWIAIRAIGM